MPVIYYGHAGFEVFLGFCIYVTNEVFFILQKVKWTPSI